MVSVLGGLALWEAVVRLSGVSSLILPAPSKIVGAFGELAESGDLWLDLNTSLRQFGAGFAIAGALGVVFGLVMGQARYVRYASEPWVLALYATPSIGLAPLFIIWLGFGFPAKAFIVALMAFFPVVINTLSGVESLAREWTDVATSFKAGPVERFRKVAFPGALPAIFTGLRLAVGRGLVGIVVADFFGAQQGLGFLILQGAQRFRTTDVFVGTILLAALGVILTALLRLVERRTCPWRLDVS
ncbi:ABC transporter permease [Amycolatopsis rhabdoformis]|uniref:ABC transporter permease n=1 Tax=Amycolatopsis rhabdoformis TaxID=1448059 RepID=A0ABZ1ICM0_9PSEU|nr:ABC transporter permease [Amycolatopsis rhabdoformis]WSE32204.1 ABC transporter permease [Amycolatopsis rhabdoformis]